LDKTFKNSEKTRQTSNNTWYSNISLILKVHILLYLIKTSLKFS
jgi:hypothetical protein